MAIAKSPDSGYYAPIQKILVLSILLALGPAILAQDRPAIAVKDADCRRIVEHQAAADVNYKPGVDVYGRPVAPADLSSNSQIKLPEEIQIPITIDLSKRLGLPTDGSLFKPEAQIGTVSVRGNRVFFNNQPLGAQDQAALQQACAERQKARQRKP
ncbi:MAG: hypothetical protein EXQ92_07485 [Alphaproteobacteria bacterium]|nr:hypothetical protein [Alphaproteobacteria bacterium]